MSVQSNKVEDILQVAIDKELSVVSISGSAPTDFEVPLNTKDIRERLSFLYGYESEFNSIFEGKKDFIHLPLITFDDHSLECDLSKFEDYVCLKVKFKDKLREQNFKKQQSHLDNNPFHWQKEYTGIDKKNSEIIFLRQMNHDLNGVLQSLKCYVDLSELDSKDNTKAFINMKKAVNSFSEVLKVSRQFCNSTVKSEIRYEKNKIKDFASRLVIDLKKSLVYGGLFSYSLSDENLEFGILDSLASLNLVRDIVTELNPAGDGLKDVSFGCHKNSLKITFAFNDSFSGKLEEFKASLTKSEDSNSKKYFIKKSLSKLDIELSGRGNEISFIFHSAIIINRI